MDYNAKKSINIFCCALFLPFFLFFYFPNTYKKVKIDF